VNYLGKFLSIEVTAKGKAWWALLFNIVLVPLFGVAIDNSFVRAILDFFGERIASFGIEVGFLTFNIWTINAVVDKRLSKYLEVFQKATLQPKTATKKEKNDLANELFDAAADLWNNRRPDGMLDVQ